MGGEKYTKKQMGDAGEMLVAAELTFHGCPAYLVPAQWPEYDVVARLDDGTMQRVSVKTRTYKSSSHVVAVSDEDEFDWLAVVVLPGPGFDRRAIYIVPRSVAERRAYYPQHRDGKGFFVHKLTERPPHTMSEADPIPIGGWGLADFEDNFSLSVAPIVAERESAFS